MKHIVFSLSFFILLTFSFAKLFNHHHAHDLHIKHKSNGADSSTTLLPTESSLVSDYTKSHEDVKQTNRIPFPLKNRFHQNLFSGHRFNNKHRSRCHHHRHRHVARDFPEVEGDDIRMLDHVNEPHYMIPNYHHGFPQFFSYTRLQPSPLLDVPLPKRRRLCCLR